MSRSLKERLQLAKQEVERRRWERARAGALELAAEIECRLLKEEIRREKIRRPKLRLVKQSEVVT